MTRFVLEGKTMLVCGIGEVLWDVFPDHEKFGGAALNFCANLQRLGDQATLLSAVGKDEHGRMALEKMHSLGLSTNGVEEVEALPTGVATVGIATSGEPTFVIHRPAAFDAISISIDSATTGKLKADGVKWIYYGTLLQTKPEIEHYTEDLARYLFPARGFYDINLRSGHWNLPLVKRLSELASVVKLNENEAQTLFALTQCGDTEFSLEGFCQMWASTFDVDVICVTLGPEGCMIYDKGSTYRVAGYAVEVCDTVGSGDAFAAAFLHGYDRGWPVSQTADFANALGALVASRAGATPDWTINEVVAMTQASK
jgi:fructokinase